MRITVFSENFSYKYQRGTCGLFCLGRLERVCCANVGLKISLYRHKPDALRGSWHYH
jgi:hypothetical protein